MHVVADDQAAEFLEHEDESVGQQHLLEVIALVEMRDEGPFEHDAEQHGQHDADDDGDEQVAGERRERERHVRADHVETPMGEIDDAHDPEDEREAARDQEQQEAVLDAVQQLNQERVDVHGLERLTRTSGVFACSACSEPYPAVRLGYGGQRGMAGIARPMVNGVRDLCKRNECKHQRIRACSRAAGRSGS